MVKPINPIVKKWAEDYIQVVQQYRRGMVGIGAVKRSAECVRHLHRSLHKGN